MQPSHLSAVIIQRLDSLKDVQAVTQDMLQNLLHHAQDYKKVLSEQHRQRFRSLTLSEFGDPFVFAHQLQTHCEKWLLAEDGDPRRIVERVVMEQFVTQLPEVITNWVQQHNPATIIEAIHLAESHPESLCLLTDQLKWTESFLRDSSQLTEIAQRMETLMQAQVEIHQKLQSFMKQGQDPKKVLSEQHRQRFRSLTVCEVGNLFKFGQLLDNYCLKWLLDENCDPRSTVERVVMEQFVNNLPQETAQRVQQHQPTTLNAAIHLAENHLSSLSSTQHLSK